MPSYSLIIIYSIMHAAIIMCLEDQTGNANLNRNANLIYNNYETAQCYSYVYVVSGRQQLKWCPYTTIRE